jgi:hypothetical protein
LCWLSQFIMLCAEPSVVNVSSIDELTAARNALMELIVWEYMDVLGEVDGEPSVSVEVPHNELQPETFDTIDTQVRAEQPNEQVCSTSLRVWVASVRDIYHVAAQQTLVPQEVPMSPVAGRQRRFPSKPRARPTNGKDVGADVCILPGTMV